MLTEIERNDLMLAFRSFFADPPEWAGALRELHKARFLQILLVGTVLILVPDPALSQEPKPGRPGVKAPVLPAPPDAGPRSLPPAVRLSDVRRGAELAIIDVRRGVNGRIRVGEVVPVEVVVKNTGNLEAMVRAQSRDLSQGAARFSIGPEAPIGPGETVILRVDLMATGSGFSIDGRGGNPLCGERSDRTITLVGAPPGIGPPGYRPGNADGDDRRPFRDGNNTDNERTVSFRFDCEVTFQK